MSSFFRSFRGVVLVVVVLAVCAGGWRLTVKQRRPSVLLVILDTLRADRLGCYGHDRDTSPHLDALAARGARFEAAISPAPWTLPATGSLLTGLPPEQAFDANLKLERSLVEDLAAAGFATAAFTEGAYVSAHFGMDRGFDSFVEQAALTRGDEQPDERAEPAAPANARATVDAGLDWLQRHGQRPFLLVLHTYQVHTPYRDRHFAGDLPSGRFGPSVEIPALHALQDGEQPPSDDELAYAAALYDSGIREVDRQVGRLLAGLDALGLADSTLVVVTSDHGEELGAHHPRFVADHGHDLTDDQLHVPLLLADPTRRWEQPVVRWQVRLADVLPTVLERLGVAPGGPVLGRSLVPLLEGRERRHRPSISGHTKTGPPRVALRDGQHKLILRLDGETPEGPALRPEPPRRQLFDLAADPGELSDLSAERRDLADELARILRTWEKQAGHALARLHPDDADAELTKRLAELGYLR